MFIRAHIRIILVLLFASSLSLSRLVAVSYDDPSIIYDPGLWTIQTSPSTSASQPSSAINLCALLLAEMGKTSTGAAVSAIVGAGFTFNFVGSVAHIITATGPNAAPFVVRQDPNVTTLPGGAITPVRPYEHEGSTCKASFTSTTFPLDGVIHTLRVVIGEGQVSIGGQSLTASSNSGHPIMQLLGIVYDDGTENTTASDSPSTTALSSKSRNVGPIVGIVLAICFAGITGVIAALAVYLRRRHPNIDGKGGTAIRVIPRTAEKGVGILTQSTAPTSHTHSSVPTFLRGLVGTIKVRADGMRLWSDDLATSASTSRQIVTRTNQTTGSQGVSTCTLLKPPLPPKSEVPHGPTDTSSRVKAWLVQHDMYQRV